VIHCGGRLAVYDQRVPKPPITLTCDCGTRGQVSYDSRWTCPSCGKAYDTSKIPAAEYSALVAGMQRYKWLTIGPPLALTVVLMPLAILWDVRFAFLLFILVIGYGLLVLPRIRGRARERVMQQTARWKLEAD
jgi:hypothetical protein